MATKFLLLCCMMVSSKQKEDFFMKKNATEIAFILDRSGSMSGLESDTIGGFNSILEKQKKEEGQAIVSTVLFDHEFDLIHNRQDITSISPLTTKEYFTRGTTALLDAIGRSVTKIRRIHTEMPEEERPTNVLFVIITDGYENASTEFNYAMIHNLISLAKMDWKWEFLFIGANLDAAQEAKKYGIDASRSARYHADSQGTKTVYSSINSSISQLRTNKTISDDWIDQINHDYSDRKKGSTK